MPRREVAEWIGATPDSKIPDRVKLRIWEREKGRCSISGRKIMPGDAFDYEHKTALCNGGSNRESNIVLALRSKHREKTAEDVAERARVDRIRKKHLGIGKKSTFPTGRNSRWKRKIGGGIVYRDTGEPVR